MEKSKLFVVNPSSNLHLHLFLVLIFVYNISFIINPPVEDKNTSDSAKRIIVNVKNSKYSKRQKTPLNYFLIRID
jgi:hypothetical protein